MAASHLSASHLYHTSDGFPSIVPTCTHVVCRCNLEQPRSDSRAQQLQRQLVGVQEDQEGWLDANNPFLAPLPPSLPPPHGALPGWGQSALTALPVVAESVEHGGGSVGGSAQGRELAAAGPGALSAPVGLSADEEQRLLAELQRLSDAGKGAEGSLLRGRMEAAQHAAELEALMTLLSQTGDGGGTDPNGLRPTPAAAAAGEAAVGGAVGTAQLAQLEREVKGLEEEEARLLASSVPAALEQLVSLQEAAVLGAHYRLQGQVLEGVLRRRTALVSQECLRGEEEGCAVQVAGSGAGGSFVPTNCTGKLRGLGGPVGEGGGIWGTSVDALWHRRILATSRNMLHVTCCYVVALLVTL